MNKITSFFTQTNKRSSMNVERLSSLAVLSVHSKRCDKIGADEVVDLFGNSGRAGKNPKNPPTEFGFLGFFVGFWYYIMLT